MLEAPRGWRLRLISLWLIVASCADSHDRLGGTIVSRHDRV